MSTWAQDEAVGRLEALPRRLVHTRAVAEKAKEISHVALEDADVLIAAAWLHDIGYAVRLAVTGFHPLDGARYLCKIGAPERLANLVARHSCAIAEARLRGLDSEVSAFPDEGGPARDALWYCDMTTSPAGRTVTLEARLEEIQLRYGDGIISAYAAAARRELESAIDRTVRRLRTSGEECQL